MNAKELPARPNLEQYKKQAKDLVKSCKAGDPPSIRRMQQFGSAEFGLINAQFIIAREHGFESWPRFAKHIKALTAGRTAASVWESAEEAIIAGNRETLERLLREHLFLREQRGIDSSAFDADTSRDASSLCWRERR